MSKKETISTSIAIRPKRRMPILGRQWASFHLQSFSYYVSIRSANAKCNCKKITHTSKKVHVRLIESLLLLPSFLCTRHSLWSIIVTVSRGIKWTGIDFCFLCPHFAVIRCRLNMLLEIGIGQWAVVCISAALKYIDSWRLQASKGLLKRVMLLLSFTSKVLLVRISAQSALAGSNV